MRLKIKELRKQQEGSFPYVGKSVTVKGWVRTIRQQKNFSFIELYDGSTLAPLQLIADQSLPYYPEIMAQITTGAAVSATGTLVASPKGNAVELQLKTMELIGSCPADSYPLQKKRHTFEFLRTIAHLRPRTNTLGAVMRVRNVLSYATHRFFQERGFLYLHTPIITASDCEGAGALFQVTTLNIDELSQKKEKVDYALDFFGQKAFLTVSGQLNGEVYASALSDIYTFGPTFRAENSNTSRHLAEFWMIEPELAFADLNDNMDNAEAYLKFVLSAVLNDCSEELLFFDEGIEKGIIDRLQAVVEQPFERVSYSYAIRILERAGKKFEFTPRWGADLQAEHERYLAEEFFKKPVILTDYPKEIKAFYMRANEDNKTVAAMDILLPTIGEVIGGSQREERLELLQQKMRAAGLPEESYWWYLDLRRYGSVPHAGYGLGLERLVQFATGMSNIRDVIPFPRTPGHAEF